MAYQMQNEGDLCNKCGKAKIVKNPKTGKTFCEDKCWLQGGEQSAPQSAPTPNSSVWEAKDRLSAGQTALNCVANVYQGKGDEVSNAVIEKRFAHFYNLLRQAKAGLVQKPEAVIDVDNGDGLSDEQLNSIPF